MGKIETLAALGAPAMVLFALGCAPGGGEPSSREGAAREAVSAARPAGRAEIEPNDGPAAANPISGDGAVTALIAPDGDEDFFSFEGAPGDRVFAATATASSASSGDTVLDLIGPDGSVLESDDDGGSLSGRASSIAGAQLARAGTHHLRVREKGGSASILPYRLHVKRQAGSPVPETEPNDLLPQPLPRSGWVEGALDPPGDVDVFTLPLQAGDTLFASLDLDPERDGIALDGALRIGVFSTTFLEIDGAGGAGARSKALFATVRAAGTYGVAVASRGAGSGAYQLSVSVEPAARDGACATFTSEDAPIAIGPAPGLVTSSITVPGHPRIGDVDVTLDMRHDRPADLDISLASPRGTRAALFTDIGLPSFPDILVTIDDEAAFPAGTTPHLHGLALQPEPTYRLDWFDGQDGGGAWTLHVNDDAAGAAGTLRGWSLTICEPPPPPACASGAARTLLAAGFEEGDDGFTHSGVADAWERGAPAQPPDFTDCHGGAACFKTGLTAGYAPASSQDLISPPIDLAHMDPPITVSWAMKYQMENGQYDAAWVEAREAGGGGASRILWRWAGPTMSTDVGGETIAQVAGWGVRSADIGELAGRRIELVFHLESDALRQFPGLAIDDVEVRACPRPVCGDGVVEGSESCDDGNRTGGDGCSATCTLESGGGGAGGSGGGGAPPAAGGSDGAVVPVGGGGCQLASSAGVAGPGVPGAAALLGVLLLRSRRRSPAVLRFVASFFVPRAGARTMGRPVCGSFRQEHGGVGELHPVSRGPAGREGTRKGHIR